MTIDISIKKYKIFNLRREYRELSETSKMLQNHIDILFKNSFIDQSDKIDLITQILKTVKIMNTSFNSYSEKEISVEKSDVYNLSNSVFDKVIPKNITDENKVFDLIVSHIEYSNILNKTSNPKDELFIVKNYSPLFDIRKKLLESIYNIGYPNIKTLLNFVLSPLHEKFVTKDVNNILNLINEIFICTSCKTVEKINEKKNYYFMNSNQKTKNDHFNRLVYIFIRDIVDINKFYKIEGYFIDDNVNIIQRTAQINNPEIYHKQVKINEKLTNKKYIGEKFRKKFLKYSPIKELLTRSDNEYCEYVDENYNKFCELKSKTFMNIIKDFTNKSCTIYDMYKMIFLLLLGDSETEDIAGLLYGLTKDRKNGSHLVSELIYNNFPCYFQTKIKKINSNIKDEIEKLKSLTPEDVDFKKQIVACKNMPHNVKALALEKIEEMKSQNNEYYKQMTFVKNLIRFPWTSTNDDTFFEDLSKDTDKAQKYLNNIEHKLNNLSYGHEEAKKTLQLQFAKTISNPSSNGLVLALQGPPGVGKTLLAKSVADALDVPFGQILLGGHNDGEILHGHGYTYSGSQPGMIIKKMVEVGKSRCILYFDELDKCTSKHGHINEITSILIHLTDPNMNKTFQDRFFQGVDFPLNKVIFIFAYNDSSLIDPILLDRFKEIRIKPYSTSDKLKIIQNFMMPEISSNIGMNKQLVNISQDNLEYMIENYTIEAGVRKIKEQLETLFLNLNYDRIFKKGLFKTDKKKINLDFKTIKKILDKTAFETEKIHEKSEIGIINGLYATEVGFGGIVPIQIFRNHIGQTADFEFKLTGTQGKVMKESVMCSYNAAVEYIKRTDSIYKNKDIDKHIHKDFSQGFHVHCPSTASPKDGPSAGCAFTCAFISRILNKPIKNTIGMTGEIDLAGNVTKIGGLPYKLMGAKKAGIKTVFVPKQNEEDYNKIRKENPKLFEDGFQVKIMSTVDEVFPQIIDN
jgi:endopeptidase La